MNHKNFYTKYVKSEAPMLKISLKLLLVLTLFFLTSCSDMPTTTNSQENMNDSFIIIAHRGASAYSPEHTIDSYQLALELGADYIEIDLQMTKDGELVALHDHTVDRTTNGVGHIRSYTLKELKNLDAGSWFNEEFPSYADSSFESLKIPTLEEIFQYFGDDVLYYIETKKPSIYPDMEEKLIELLRKYNLIGDQVQDSKVILQSFSPDSLNHIHKMEPNIPLIQLISYKQPAKLTKNELSKLKEYAVGVGPNFNMISEEYIKTARAAGLLVHPYTVNQTNDMEKLIDWGATGAFTNYSDTLYNVLKQTK